MSGFPPAAARTVKPPAEKPKAPMRSGSIAARPGHACIMYEMIALSAVGRPSIRVARLLSRQLSPGWVSAATMKPARASATAVST
ncbi:hypothetical protein [Sphingomonas sp. Leaf22]|uniref:hypothetical protein n=1 Tax=Sphingomonas sp. Leaf22 TaxID=1735687 RepID=UPI001F2332AE|nr:hypothetical protein [Sphingomonas sp. Leaf22]